MSDFKGTKFDLCVPLDPVLVGIYKGLATFKGREAEIEWEEGAWF